MPNFLYYLTHSAINAHFSKNSTDFVVREVPLYEFSGNGEWCVVLIQKKDLTTNQALQIFSEQLGVKMREFGYAGLKDKEGLTIQYICFPAKFEANLANFSHEKIKILSQTRHENKLRIGHLKGNNFFIRLKKVLPVEAQKIKNAFENIANQGFANYFGYQRFGKFGDNYELGLAILRGEKSMKNPKMRDFLISAYQSKLFNLWLEKRVEISKFANEFSLSELAKIYGFDKESAKQIASQPQFYKLLGGEVLGHFPYGKFFVCENLDAEVQRFLKRDITSAGLLVGKSGIASSEIAKKFEDEIFSLSYEFSHKMTGSRRFAWSFIDNAKFSYDENKAQVCLEFYLPKGSYATVVLEEILHCDIFDGAGEI